MEPQSLRNSKLDEEPLQHWERASMVATGRWLTLGRADRSAVDQPRRNADPPNERTGPLLHRRDGGSGDPDRDPRTGVDPDRFGLARVRRSRSQADRARAQGSRRLRPSRPPGHDPLAHGPLRRGGRLAKQIEIKHFWDRGLPEDNDPRLDFPDGPKADDPLGIAYRQASRGKRTPSSRETRSSCAEPDGRWSWPRAARSIAPPRRLRPATRTVREQAADAAGRSFRQCPEPGDPLPVRQV